MLIAGIDENGPQLYVSVCERPPLLFLIRSPVSSTDRARYNAEPSGTFVRYDAMAIGAGSEGAQTSLRAEYHAVSANRVPTTTTRSPARPSEPTPTPDPRPKPRPPAPSPAPPLMHDLNRASPRILDRNRARPCHSP